MTRRAEIGEAAAIAAAGMDPMLWLMTTDNVERITMQAVARVYHEQRAKEHGG